MRTIKKLCILCLGILCITQAHAQIKSMISVGNKKYEKKQYQDAEKTYQDALQKDPENYAAMFNKGDAMYQQKKYKEAAAYFQRAGGLTSRKDEKEESYYNLGNSYLKMNDLVNSIDAYKKALKLNPDDMYAKSNLSYALAMKKKNDKQQQNQQRPPAGGQSTENPKGNKDVGNNARPKPDKDQSGISEEEADRLMDAMNNNESKIRQRLYKNQRKREREGAREPW